MAKQAPQPVPEGMNTLTTHLWFSGNAREALEFYKKALGAEQIGMVAPTPDGKGLMHAMLRIGDSHIMLADAWPNSWETGATTNATAGLWVYAKDCDALYNQAVEAGCEVMQPIMDAFWGDRMGKVKDPFGHTWAIASHKWVYTPEEIRANELEWLKSMETS